MKALLTFVIAMTLGAFTSIADDANPPAKRVPFRFYFDGYTGDPKLPEAMTFRVSALDVSNHIVTFLKLGQLVPGTTYALRSFRYIVRRGPNFEDDDASELTLVNQTTNEEIVLTHMKVFDLSAPRTPKPSAIPTPK